MISNASIDEQVRKVKGPELVFCKDHNLLMYPKSAVPESGFIESDLDLPSSESSSSSDDDSEDDLEDIAVPEPLFR